MTRNLIAAALLTTFAAPAAAEMSPQSSADGSVTIVVSCDRGPMQAVIIDAPAPVFIDSLVAAGYDYTEANAIGRRLCRDKSLVNDPEGLKAEMLRIYNATR